MHFEEDKFVFRSYIVAVPVFSAGHEGTLARYNGGYSKDYNWLICNIERLP